MNINICMKVIINTGEYILKTPSCCLKPLIISLALFVNSTIDFHLSFEDPFIV